MEEDNKKMVEELTKIPVIACVGEGSKELDTDAGFLAALYLSLIHIWKAGQPEHGFLYNSGYHCRRRENEESKGVHKRCGRL